MRLLFDANLSPGVADALSEVGHEVVGVFDVGLADASDTTILARAESEQRVIVSHDTDFRCTACPPRSSYPCDGDGIVIGHLIGGRKATNIARDPRVVLIVGAERANPVGVSVRFPPVDTHRPGT